MSDKKFVSVGMVAPEFYLPQGGPVWYSTSLPKTGSDDAAAPTDTEEAAASSLDWVPTSVSLRERRAFGHVVLYFLRALYCPSGHANVRRLTALKATLANYEATPLVIGPGTLDEAAALVERLKPPFPVLADEKGDVVATYGFRKAFLNTVQQSGVVLIDRGGVVRYVRRVTNPMAGLDADALFLALRNL